MKMKDWLCGLIFGKFREAWERAQREGKGRFGPASSDMLIEELSAFALAKADCAGEVVSRWLFNGNEFKALSLSDDVRAGADIIQGMFYRRASARFAVSEDRKTVVLNYTFGPRYGRGFVLDVKGQGDAGHLEIRPGSAMWQS